MGRWIRSLNAQLFLWAVLPITFLIIAFSFSGVYSHQQAMRDFVARRDLSLAHVIAQNLARALDGDLVTTEGAGVPAWLADQVDGHPVTTRVVAGGGPKPARILAQTGPTLADPTTARQPFYGAQVVPGQEQTVMAQAGELLLAIAPVPGVDWSVLVVEPVSELTGPLLRVPSMAPLVAASAGILSVLVLTFGWTTIVRPLRTLSQAAGQVAWGDYSAIAAPVGGVQEVRDLRQALADMVDRIRDYEAALRDYTGAMTHGQELERARLARELHDGPVQDLIVLRQQAEMAEHHLAQNREGDARALLETMRVGEQRIVRELRRLIHALRPAYLEDLGLAPALEMLVKEADERGSAAVRLKMASPARRLPEEIELAAYRIAQEALSNAIAHAQADEIVVRLTLAQDQLLLQVIDDGVGFTLPEHPSQLTRSAHYGLVGMRERASLLGGRVQIVTAPGQGTQVTAELPTEPSGDGQEPS